MMSVTERDPLTIYFDLNQSTRHWYGTGSGSDRAPAEMSIAMEPGRYRTRYRTAVCPNVVLSDLDSGQFPMAVATNFRISFDLFRAVRTSLSVDERQALRKRVKGCEDHSNCASQHKQNYCCLAHSKPHCLTSV